MLFLLHLIFSLREEVGFASCFLDICKLALKLPLDGSCSIIISLRLLFIPLNYWTNQYETGNQMPHWPWSKVIEYFCKAKKLSGKTSFKVLELGAGNGANIKYFLEQDQVEYYAVDFSPVAKQLAISNNKDLSEMSYIVGDISDNSLWSRLPYEFDIIFDRACLTHLSHRHLPLVVHHIKERLSNPGYFIGIDWFGSSHPDYKSIDSNTCTEHQTLSFNSESSGMFKGLGTVSFWDQKKIRDLFADFQFNIFEHEYLDNLLSPSSSIDKYHFLVSILS